MTQKFADPNPHAVEAVYDELKSLAARYMARERNDHTLQPTALVHEAYLRLADSDATVDRNRAQFFARAATIIRRVLIDHAKKRNAVKRGGNRNRVLIEGDFFSAPEQSLDILTLNEKLDQLANIDPRMSRIVELRAFGGLTIAETADALDISTSTVERDWDFACSWLKKEISKGDPDDA